MSEAARLLLTWREWLCITLSVILVSGVIWEVHVLAHRGPKLAIPIGGAGLSKIQT